MASVVSYLKDIGNVSSRLNSNHHINTNLEESILCCFWHTQYFFVSNLGFHCAKSWLLVFQIMAFIFRMLPVTSNVYGCPLIWELVRSEEKNTLLCCLINKWLSLSTNRSSGLPWKMQVITAVGIWMISQSEHQSNFRQCKVIWKFYKHMT